MKPIGTRVAVRFNEHEADCTEPNSRQTNWYAGTVKGTLKVDTGERFRRDSGYKEHVLISKVQVKFDDEREDDEIIELLIDDDIRLLKK